VTISERRTAAAAAAGQCHITKHDETTLLVAGCRVPSHLTQNLAQTALPVTARSMVGQNSPHRRQLTRSNKKCGLRRRWRVILNQTYQRKKSKEN